MKVEVKMTFEADVPLDMVKAGKFRLMHKGTGDKRFCKLNTSDIEFQKLITIEDDLTAVEDLQYTDGKEDEFNDSLERVLKFAWTTVKEKNENNK